MLSKKTRGRLNHVRRSAAVTSPGTMKRRHEFETAAKSALSVRAFEGYEGLVEARVLSRFNQILDPREGSLAKAISANGFWESWVTLAICDYVKPGMVCVDAGAHCGYFTMLLADLTGDGGEVIAVEPNVEMVELLCLSARANDFAKRIQIHSYALWDESGETMTLSIPGSLAGSGSLIGHGPPPRGEQVKTQTVKTITLDELLAGHTCDFVKIDCEGAEARIWRGMRETWRRSSNIAVCAEYAPTPEHREFLKLVREEGARVRLVDFTGELREMSGEPNALRMIWIDKP